MHEDSGYQFPEDILLVSFINVYLSKITRPPLTTVDVQIYEL
ncbi:hypothetical protein [Lentibacillus populi]|nr:hypothetical protein [Lentibacillus populi]